MRYNAWNPTFRRPLNAWRHTTATQQGYCQAVVSLLTVSGGLLLLGCASSPVVESHPIGETLIGKSKQALLSCAGSPLREDNVADGTVLRYYRETPMLDESFGGSKASKTGIHGGC